MLCSCKLKHFALNDIFRALTTLCIFHYRKASLPSSPHPFKQCWATCRKQNKAMMFVGWEEGSMSFFLKNHTPFDNNSVADRTCFRLWCRPYLAANCDLFKIRTFPWSPSKVRYILPLHTQSRFQVHLHYTWSSSVKPTIIRSVQFPIVNHHHMGNTCQITPIKAAMSGYLLSFKKLKLVFALIEIEFQNERSYFIIQDYI